MIRDKLRELYQDEKFKDKKIYVDRRNNIFVDGYCISNSISAMLKAGIILEIIQLFNVESFLDCGIGNGRVANAVLSSTRNVNYKCYELNRDLIDLFKNTYDIDEGDFFVKSIDTFKGTLRLFNLPSTVDTIEEVLKFKNNLDKYDIIIAKIPLSEYVKYDENIFKRVYMVEDATCHIVI